jgi:hypothetical protein
MSKEWQAATGLIIVSSALLAASIHSHDIFIVLQCMNYKTGTLKTKHTCPKGFVDCFPSRQSGPDAGMVHSGGGRSSQLAALQAKIRALKSQFGGK